MNRNSFFALILLTAIWVILREDFTVVLVAIGVAVSAVCLLLCRKLIPSPGTTSIKPLRLLVYFFYLIGQIYVAAFSAIRLITTGAHTEVVQIKTRAKSTLFRTLLSNSITLVPGSVTLDLEDDTITVLWLVEEKPDGWRTINAEELILGKLERILMKAEKR